MRVQLVDMSCDDTRCKYTFTNDDTSRIYVVSMCDVNALELYRSYDIYIMHESAYTGSVGPIPRVFSQLGVIVRKTSAFTQVQCGGTEWYFPLETCKLACGQSVWISVRSIV